MILFAMDRRQYVLVIKAIDAYIHSLEAMYKKWPPPKNPYQLMREQNTLMDVKALQDLLADLKARDQFV